MLIAVARHVEKVFDEVTGVSCTPSPFKSSATGKMLLKKSPMPPKIWPKKWPMLENSAFVSFKNPCAMRPRSEMLLKPIPASDPPPYRAKKCPPRSRGG